MCDEDDDAVKVGLCKGGEEDLQGCSVKRRPLAVGHACQVKLVSLVQKKHSVYFTHTSVISPWRRSVGPRSRRS